MRRVQAVIVGLILAQGWATLQVYLSNAAYLDKLTALQKAGYLTVPNRLVMDTLARFGPAFFGGLFFTLTVGLALSLAALTAAWISNRFFPESRGFQTGLLVFWAGTLVWVNQDGWAPLASAYLLVIPPSVFYLARRQTAASAKGRSGRRVLLHPACILILLMVGADQMTPGMFTRIRDRLLLTNPVGRSINDFYYRYTLYPAQVFKSPAQDLIRAVYLAENLEPPLAEQLKWTLTRLDYPVIDTPKASDLVIYQNRESLIFAHDGKSILSVPPDALLKSPRDTLQAFSRGVDRFGPFRRVTFLSLMAVSGLFIYLILYLPSYFFAWIFGRAVQGRFQKPLPVSMAAAVLCVGAGITLFSAASAEKPPRLPPDLLKNQLTSPDPAERVTALRYLYARKIDIAPYEVHRKMAKSPQPLERYWLARVLEFSRSPQTYETNLALLSDPQINTAYMAYLALGRRGDRRAVGEILERLKSEDRWYVQLYAYKALRRLGWRQTVSG
ncbi:MAG: HEAT repeat domain-containing protein [Thermodesulfobacteriota bacterium]